METTIITANNHRAVTYLPNGQRIECMLPEGEWVVLGDCLENGIEAIKLRRKGDFLGRIQYWYVGRVSFECREA